jgi:pyruvate dehydrogenase E1 component beta subunit
MSEKDLFGAIEATLASCMAEDERIVVIGEDAHMFHAELYARFGAERVVNAPISEASFVGAAAAASMAGLRPVVDVMLVDFVAVAMDAVLNEASKVEAFSGGQWSCPFVIRSACGGGYGDGGQHEQTLWGMLAGIPGLTVLAPSMPGDAAGLMRSAIEHGGPVVFLEHKILSQFWLNSMGRGGRTTVEFDVPHTLLSDHGKHDEVVPIGSASVRRAGGDVTLVSAALGVHRCLEAAERLSPDISCEVVDLRSIRPLDVQTLVKSVSRTRRLVVVDEDYRDFGLSGEVAAVALEAGLAPAFARVCTEGVIPYARDLEDSALPGVARIADAVQFVLT